MKKYLYLAATLWKKIILNERIYFLLWVVFYEVVFILKQYFSDQSIKIVTHCKNSAPWIQSQIITVKNKAMLYFFTFNTFTTFLIYLIFSSKEFKIYFRKLCDLSYQCVRVWWTQQKLRLNILLIPLWRLSSNVHLCHLPTRTTTESLPDQFQFYDGIWNGP